MKTKHTKGEWKVVGKWIKSGNKIIATLWAKKNPKQEQANARLIAAAPDLLRALQGDEENCVPNAQTILSQALLGNYEAVKSMLRELCSIHATAIAKAENKTTFKQTNLSKSH